MHFGAAQRFAASIAGVKQTSLKLRAEASAGLPRSIRGMQACGAGLPRSVRGHAGLWRGMFSERGGWFRAMYRAPRVHFAFGELARIEGHAGLWRAIASQCQGIWLCGAGCSRNVGVVSYHVPRAARSFAFGELPHIEALAFCVRAPRVHFAFGELAHIEALVFCVQAARVSNIRAVASDCMTKRRDYEFRVFDPPRTCLPKNHNKFAKNLFTK